MEDDYAIGLDLGTTYSCIGVYRKGGVEIIPNSMGERITPSVVIFNDDEILVGEDTTDILVKHYDNCIYEVKRLIGLDITNEKYKEEIKKLPFKVVESNKKKCADIEVTIKGKKKNYSPVEISSLIIKKMVHNAENYLNKTIKNLVITVPAYFNEDQKKLTQQAAEMLDLKVLKIINEPTAAALAYGFTKEKLENKKILVFDLGGGTFDVSILSFEKEQNKEKQDIKHLIVLSISGDMHLGGEDFDYALAEYILNKRKIPENIRKNPQTMKKLKVACETAKKILSFSDKTILRINNFDKNMVINETITRKEFEQECQPLFDRLILPINTALSNGHLGKEDISEVILIGGSTRIPKVKEIINEFFKGKVKINDSINADEAVAYGATLQAEKILYNNDQIISNFHILDITPFSLGVCVLNQSKEEEIKKLGDEMSVIIKRGTPLPTFNKRNYVTVFDNQTEVNLKIYEGEKKYVKQNHLIKETTIKGLSPKPKGETQISVEFKIDKNGILFVEAVETSEERGKTFNLTIKNDEVSFTEEEMKKLKERMEDMIKKVKYKELSEDFDYTNLFESLKSYKDSYDKCKPDEVEDKLIYLKNFNEALEEFIDAFEQNFDNETLLEKFYLYIKELFQSYIKYLKLSPEKSEKNAIYENINKYTKIFINKSSAYLNNLLEILSSLYDEGKNNDYINLIISIMDQLNAQGEECIKNNEAFCKYHSLMYFEQSYSYYEKYLSQLNINKLDIKTKKKLNIQKQKCLEYINDINSGAIIFVAESLKKGILFDESSIEYDPHKSGFTINYIKLGLGKTESIKNKEEIIELILREYEKLLAMIQISDKPTEKEAICIANIIKINNMQGLIEPRKKYLFSLADRCKLIIDRLKLGEKEWAKKFLDLYNLIQPLNTQNENYQQTLERIRKNNPEFDELDNEFNKNHGKKEFIDYLITKHPYPNMNDDEEKEKQDFNKYSPELARFLMKKYQPDNFSENASDEYQKKYCLLHEISSKLSNMITNIQ